MGSRTLVEGIDGEGKIGSKVVVEGTYGSTKIGIGGSPLGRLRLIILSTLYC